ncbi:arrestin family protein [Aspergillus brunneoviolaceus CBS 621.78]|uniref:HECT-type ubiquitin ligase-interacting protein cred n=1 Tax=Aspergillus brunneoviolaceus CBS 621.78 TaxID=1450534 RepID=A0ACD1FZ70_9EURO|nr:putative HECT-type ubiquitin ligase-interacting protein cred [Aspergillus brunneoviolaceus CBS 621.78]RAH42247.1 putative HECT-type ubiquitin ligase-interacting protein cred [Aspergillus brunneoviolaceus CBS 621.78]
MALSFFGAGGASHAKYFDIRLDEDYIVFRGGEEEAASAHLSGKLLLCLSEPLSIKHIRLHLTGISRVCWHLPSTTAGGGRKSWREKIFYEKTWRFREAGKSKTEVLPAGNYEYPFDIVLEGSMPESVEGLTDTYVTYRFKAEIGRKYMKDITVRRPLRIIRTLEASALELAHAMSVENVWPNKIEYSISTPTKAVVFGTSIRVDFKLIPLLKGLRIGQIVSQLIESHDLTLNPEDPDSIRNTYKSTRTILNDEHEVDEESGLDVIDEMAEGYQFTRYLDLPKTLARCLQDTDTRGIKIRHKLKFRVQLLNPDGHVSELRATLPVSIFISPNLAIDENNNLIDQTPQSAQRAISDIAQQAPPLYGEHQFDQLYSELDPSGYRTPGPGSGPGTPFGALSRNISVENLASMNALTNTDISASALHSRLSSLRANLHNHPSPPEHEHHSDTETRRLGVPPDYFGPSSGGSGSNSHSPASPELSRRPSDEVIDHDPIHSGMATPYHPQYAEVETLSRVPSYSTAVRTSVRPCDSGLPDYQAVIAEDVVSSTPQSPQQAYIRSRGSNTYLPSLDSLQTRTGFLGSRAPHHDDDDRRLRLVQARAR